MISRLFLRLWSRLCVCALVLTGVSCLGRAPTLACVDDADCAAGFFCSEEKQACVVIAVSEGEGEGESGEGEGEGESGEGEGEGAEGEGEAAALAFTRFEREPSTPTVVAYEPLIVRWTANDDDATCVVITPDGNERAAPFEGEGTFTPGIDGTIAVRCTNAEGEISESTSFDVVLPNDVDASWHPPFVATHPWRVDVTFTSAGPRRAFAVDVPVDLAGLLADAGVPDAATLPSSDSVRAARVAADGSLVVLEPYYAADTGLLFVQLPPLDAGASVVVQVYFAPVGAPAWGEAPYLDDHVGPASPITLNRGRNVVDAVLDVNGFDASPFSTQEIVYERGARLVVGADAATTPVHAQDGLPRFPAVTSGPTLRVDNTELTIIEQRVQGVGGVDVVEVLTIAKTQPAAIRFTTVLLNTTGAPLADVRFSTLMDLDVPGVFDNNPASNSARAIGGVPAVCENSGTLCGALAGEASTGFRVGRFPESSQDFVTDQFVGLTDGDVLDDKRLAVTWLVPSLGARQVLHSALAVNETFDFSVADTEAVAAASSLANTPAVAFSPTWIRD